MAATNQGAVSDGIWPEELSTLRVRLALLQRLETSLVFAVDSAREEPSKDERHGVFHAVEEAARPVALPVGASGDIFSIPVATGASVLHRGLSLWLLHCR